MYIFFRFFLVIIFLSNISKGFGNYRNKYLSIKFILVNNIIRDTTEPDTDLDGIPDSIDKCPNIPGYARYDGCPIPDLDQDGINDEVDNCPHTFGLTQYYGCPDLQNKINQWLNKGQIKNGTKPDNKMYQSLDSIIGLLKINTSLKLEISTQKKETDSNSQKIESNSKYITINEQWLETYFVNKGVNAKRLIFLSMDYNSKLRNNKNLVRFIIHYNE